MRKAFLLLTFLLAHLCCSAQLQEWPLQIAVFSNATALPPGIATRLFTEPLHPGLSLGTSYTYRQKGAHQLLQTAKLGYFYHRYIQHAVQVYSELGYRYSTRFGMDVGPLLGVGYLHAIPAHQVFELNNRGEFEKKANFGRAQAMVTTSLELGYTTTALTPTPLRFTLSYQCWLQSPFVVQYVPVLPNTALHAGVSFSLRKKSL